MQWHESSSLRLEFCCGFKRNFFSSLLPVGIRMLDGDVTDIVEALSLSFRQQYINIYLAGWGPEDNGATLEGPGPLARLALQTGAETVRERGHGETSWLCLLTSLSALYLFLHKFSYIHGDHFSASQIKTGPKWEGFDFCVAVRERWACG